MAERETRRQRQERRREEQRLRQEQERGRQRWQKGLVAVGTVLVVAVSGSYGISQFLQSQEPAAVQIDEVRAEQEVRQEIERLGIQKSAKEIELWQQMQLASQSQREFLTASSKLNYVISAMQHSENPYFQETAQSMQQMVKEGIVYPQIIPLPPGMRYLLQETQAGIISTGLQLVDGKPVIVQTAYHEVILEANPEQIALVLVHEIKHAKNIRRRDEQNLHLTPQERISSYINTMIQADNFIQEEASGVMEQSLAAIYHIGLTDRSFRGREVYASDYQELAMAIRSGIQEDNPLWKDYIAKEYNLLEVLAEKKRTLR